MIPTTGVANRGVGLEWVAAAGSTDVPCVAVAGGAIEAAGTADDAGVAGVAFATVSTAVAGASIVAGATAEADAAGSSSSDGAESTTESGTRSAGTGAMRACMKSSSAGFLVFFFGLLQSDRL